MEQVPITLTREHAKKLMQGKTVQLKHHHLAGNQHYIMLDHKKAHRMHKARMQGKGMRLSLHPHEMQANGEGFLDFFKNLGKNIKKGYDWVEDHVIKTPFYQQNVKPIVRGLVNAGETAISARAPPAVQKIANAGIEAIGAKTGAFGLKGHKRGSARMQSNYSPFMGFQSAAMNPQMAALPPIGGGSHVYHHHMYHPVGMRDHPVGMSSGGSFLPA